MALETPLDPARTAVLSMDMQAAIVSIYAGGDAGLVTRAARVLGRCRECGTTVIHVQVGFRPGLPEIHPRNALFAAIRTSPERQQLFQGDAGKIHPAVAPAGSEVVITKHRISAFTGTDLDMILRAREIDTLVMFGIATSGVVLSTLLDAVDGDYRTIVVTDCCVDRDAELHAVLIDRFFPHRGSAMTAAELLETLRG
jgi:nicotinamidase-related amidase